MLETPPRQRRPIKTRTRSHTSIVSEAPVECRMIALAWIQVSRRCLTEPSYSPAARSAGSPTASSGRPSGRKTRFSFFACTRRRVRRGGWADALSFAERSLVGNLKPPARRQLRDRPRRRWSGRRDRSARSPGFPRQQGGVRLRWASLRALLRQLSREEGHAPSLARKAGLVAQAHPSVNAGHSAPTGPGRQRLSHARVAYRVFALFSQQRGLYEHRRTMHRLR